MVSRLSLMGVSSRPARQERFCKGRLILGARIVPYPRCSCGPGLGYLVNMTAKTVPCKQARSWFEDTHIILPVHYSLLRPRPRQVQVFLGWAWPAPGRMGRAAVALLAKLPCLPARRFLPHDPNSCLSFSRFVLFHPTNLHTLSLIGRWPVTHSAY